MFPVRCSVRARVAKLADVLDPMSASNLGACTRLRPCAQGSQPPRAFTPRCGRNICNSTLANQSNKWSLLQILLFLVSRSSGAVMILDRRLRQPSNSEGTWAYRSTLFTYALESNRSSESEMRLPYPSPIPWLAALGYSLRSIHAGLC